MKRHTFIKLLSSFAFFSVAPDLLLSLPQNAEIASGTAEFTQSEPSSLVISTSDKAIINYKSFDIGKKEKVKFIQPSSSSSVLNRVKGKDPSKILGSLESNGRVFLVNPKGVYFGPSATVNVGSLIVSALDIADQDFIDDKWQFSLSSDDKDSKILNEGLLSASSEGSIVLLAPKIQNKGIIEAKAGKVLLAAGEAVTLDFSGDGLISFSVDGDLKDAVIEHLGKIQAPEGDVYLRLNAAEKAIKTIINTDGLEEGAVFVEEAGVIRLVSLSTIESKNIAVEGFEGSHVEVNGSLDVSSTEKGGTVHITAEDIRVEGANINASGDQGGGIVLIGGDYQGKGDLFRSQSTIVDQASTVKADAISQGDGGQVIIWSDGRTQFEGNVFARGGSLGGDGGLVETSGKENLQVFDKAYVNTLALQGKAGNWLLDPTTILIQGGGVDPLPSSCTVPAGAITIDPNTIANAATNVTLCASTSITQIAGATINMVNNNIGITFQGSPGVITTTLNDSISTRAGALTFTSTNVVLGAATVSLNTTLGGQTAGADVSFSGTVNANVAGSQGLSINGGTGGSITFSGDVGVTNALNGLTISNGLKATVGNISSRGTGASGQIQLTLPVVLGSSATITTTAASGTGANIVMASVNGTTTGAQTLTVTPGTTSTIQIPLGIGGTVPLGNISMTNGTTATLGNITTNAGSINISPGVVLAAPGPSYTFDTTNGNAGGAAITLTTVDAQAAGGQGVTLKGGTGGAVIVGIVGGGTALGSFSIASGSSASIRNISTQAGTINVTPAATLSASTIIDTTANASAGAAITLGTVNATTAGAQTLELRGGGAGSVTIGATGGTTPLGTFSISNGTGANIQSITTAGATLSIGTATTLTANATLSTTGNSVTTGNDVNLGPVSGAHNLVVNTGTVGLFSVGGVNIGDAVGNVSLNITTASGTISFSPLVLAGGLTTSKPVSFGQNTTINGALSVPALTAQAAAIDVSLLGGGTVSGTTTISNTGNLTLHGVLNTFSFDSALNTSTVGSLNLSGTIQTISAAEPITFTPATLDGNTSLVTANSDIVLAPTNATTNGIGAEGLTLNAGTGNISFLPLGGTTPLGLLNITAATTVLAHGDVITRGDATAGGTITITPSLQINSVTFSTTGTGGAVTAGGNISLGVVNAFTTGTGAESLTLDAGTGGVATLGALGGTNPLGLLSIPNALSVTANGNITIRGDATAGGTISIPMPITLGATETFTTTGAGAVAGGNITLGAINATLTTIGAEGLTLNAGNGGALVFTSMGAVTPLGNVNISGANTVRANGNITTKGNATAGGTITISRPLILGATAAFTTTGGSATGGAAISLTTVNALTASTAAEALTLDAGAGGAISLGIVGGANPLGKFSITGGSQVTPGDITTRGDATAGGTISIIPATILLGSHTFATTGALAAAGANISLGDVDATLTTVNAEHLILDAGSGGAIAIGTVGGTTPLGLLDITAATGVTANGNITIRGDATGGGTLSIVQPLILGANATFTTTGGGVTAGNDITLGPVDGGHTFSINAGTGGTATASFGAIGGGSPLTSLTATGATVTQNSTVVTTGLIDYTGATAINVGGDLTTSAGTVSWHNAATLTADVAVDTTSGAAGGASITLAAVDGAHIFSLNAGNTGTAAFGAIGGTAPLTSLTATGATVTQNSTVVTTGLIDYTGTTAINVGGNQTTSGGTVSWHNPAILATTITINTTNGGAATGANISLGDVDATLTTVGAEHLTLNAGSGGAVALGAVGGTKPLGLLSITDATGLTANSNITIRGDATGGGTLSIAQPITLGGNATFTTTGGGVTAGNAITLGTVNGGHTFSLNAGTTGTAAFGTIGGTAPLTSLTATGATVTQNSTVVTTGLIDYTGATAINVGGDLTTSAGTVSWHNAATLTADVAVNTTSGAAGGASITLAAVDGAHIFSLNAGNTGTAAFGAIGGTAPLTSLTATGATVTQNSTVVTTGLIDYTGTAAINVGGNQTTSAGTVDWHNATTLTANVTVDTTSGAAGGAGITLAAVNGAHTFSLNAGNTGTAAFGAIGGFTPPTSLTVTAATLNQNSTVKTTGLINYTGTTAINVGGNQTTSAGIVTWNNHADLTADVVVDTTNGGLSSAGANINLAAVDAAVAGAEGLTLDLGTTGVATYGAIGAIRPLSHFIINGSSAIHTGSITTDGGPITFAQPIILDSTAVFDTTGGGTSPGGSDITLAAVDATTVGVEGLTLDGGTTGAISFGVIGGTTPLGNFSVTNGVSVTANSITTQDGTIDIVPPITLGATSTFDTTNAGASAGASITLSTVDATTSGAQDLTLNAGTSSVSFGGAVGGGTPLGALTITANAIAIPENVSTASASQTYTGVITLSKVGTTTFTAATAGSITFNSNVTGTISNQQALTVSALGGNVNIIGNLGTPVALGAINISAAPTTIIISGDINTGGAPATFATDVLVTATPTITTSGGAVSFDSTLDFQTTANTLTINAGAGPVTFTGAVGAGTPGPFGALAVTGSSILQSSTVNGAGNLTYTGPANINGNINLSAGQFSASTNVLLASNITTTNAPLSIGGNLTIAQAATPVLTSGSGALTITGTTDGTVGGAAETLTLDAAGGVINVGALGSGVATQLTTVTITNGAATTFNGPINITGALTQTNAATGTTTFLGTVSVGSATLRGINFALNNNFTSSGVIAVTNSGTFTKNAVGFIGAALGFSTTGDVNLASNITAVNTALSIGGNLTLADGVTSTLTSGSGPLTITGATDGTLAGAPETLILNAPGGVINVGALGSGVSSQLTTVTVTDGATTNFNGAINITGVLSQTNAATGTTTFGSTVSVGNAILRGTSFALNNSFASTGSIVVTNTGTLTKNSTGNITATTGFGTSGDVNLASNITTTNSPLSIGGSLTLAQGVTSTLTSGSGALTVTGATDGTAGVGTETLVLNALGGVINLGAVGSGSSTQLTTVTITNGATTTFNAAVNITGALTQTNAATGATTFSSTVAVGSATLRGTSYAFNNSVTSTGAISIDNSGTVTKNSTGNITANGGFSTTGDMNLASNITTVNTPLSIGANLTIAEAATPVLTSGSGALTITGTTDGVAGGVAETLTLDATGGVINVGGLGTGVATQLTTVTITHGAATTFNGPIDLTGALTQTNAATGTTAFTNTVSVGSATLRGTTFLVLNDFTSSGAISVTNSGTLTKNSVGNIGAAGGFSTTGAVNLASNITTTNTALSIGGNLTIAEGASPTLSNLAGSSNITITGTTNGTAGGGNENLTLLAGTGVVTFTGAVGGTTPLGNLIFTSASLIQVGSNITTLNALTFPDPVSLTGNSVITSTAGLTFNTTIDGNQNLTLAAGASAINLQGDIGAVTPVNVFTITSAGTIDAQAIHASSIDIVGTGVTTFHGAITASGGMSVNTGPIFLGSTIDTSTLSLKAQGSILNSGAPVAINTSGAPTFNAVGGDVGTLASPVQINTSQVITVGADPAYFEGTPDHDCVNYVASNPPAFVIFNGVVIIQCGSPPTPGGGGGSVVVIRIPPRDFYVQGIYSSWDNLSNYYYFLPNSLSQEQTDLKRVPLYAWAGKDELFLLPKETKTESEEEEKLVPQSLYENFWGY